MIRVVVVLLVAGVAMSLLDKHFSRSWAVEVEGGQEAADEVARKHGFVNRGKIGNLESMYHFELLGGEDEHLPEKTEALKRETLVNFVEQQHYKKMVKKGPY